MGFLVPAVAILLLGVAGFQVWRSFEVRREIRDIEIDRARYVETMELAAAEHRWVCGSFVRALDAQVTMLLGPGDLSWRSDLVEHARDFGCEPREHPIRVHPA